MNSPPPGHSGECPNVLAEGRGEAGGDDLFDPWSALNVKHFRSFGRVSGIAKVREESLRHLLDVQNRLLAWRWPIGLAHGLDRPAHFRAWPPGLSGARKPLPEANGLSWILG